MSTSFFAGFCCFWTAMAAEWPWPGSTGHAHSFAPCSAQYSRQRGSEAWQHAERHVYHPSVWTDIFKGEIHKMPLQTNRNAWTFAIDLMTDSSFPKTIKTASSPSQDVSLSPSPHLLSPHFPLVLSFLMSKMSILHVGVHGTRVGALPPRSVPQWLCDFRHIT